ASCLAGPPARTPSTCVAAALRDRDCAAYAVSVSEARVWSVTSTVPTKDRALSLARIAVNERLAAGAEVTGPAVSVFWHLGELGEGEEWRVTLRTSSTARDRLAARLAELHPLESPEVT